MVGTLIDNQDDLQALCEEIREEGLVAFDTEFVSEASFRPELCLLQLATDRRLVAVDPFAVEDLGCWWQIVTDAETTVVVHGGQAEIRFCLERTGEPPKNFLDIQIAEGLRSRSYPLSYEALVERVLGEPAPGKETRTDWRRRPLSGRQLDYALRDVQFVLPIWRQQRDWLAAHNRLPWAEAEFRRLVDDITADWSRPGWQRLSGLHKLKPRQLAVVRELFEWRQQEAARKNKPERRVLRDDLLLEVARRQPKTPKELRTIREMDRPHYKRITASLLQAVSRALQRPAAEHPQPPARRHGEEHQEEQILGKLLGIVLAHRCAEMDVAMPLVATSADLRQLVRWHVYGDDQDGPPRLVQGWRAELCGNLLRDVLDGKVAFRVAGADSDHPLIFEHRDNG